MRAKTDSLSGTTKSSMDRLEGSFELRDSPRQRAAQPILITGATGLIGGALVRRLLMDGHHVAALDIMPFPAFTATAALRYAQFDVRDTQSLSAIIRELRPAAVIHLAARHFIPDCIQDPSATWDVNVGGTASLISALIQYPPEVVVFASSAAVYTPSYGRHDENSPVGPIDCYGASKAECEKRLIHLIEKRPNISLVITRLCNVYGPHDPNPHIIPVIMQQLSHGNKLRVGDTRPRRDYIFVEDAADILASCLEYRGSPFTLNVGSGHDTSVRELISLTIGLFARKIEVVSDPTLWRNVDRPVLAITAERLHRSGFFPRSLHQGLLRTYETAGLIT